MFPKKVYPKENRDTHYNNYIEKQINCRWSSSEIGIKK